MIRNYFKIALRNLKKHKGYSFINITGLAIGMACTILIFLWVQDELSYDTFHENVDNLYRIKNYEKYTSGEEVTFSQCPPNLAEALRNELPEIVNTARFRRYGKVSVQNGDKIFNADNFSFTDESFLKMFTFPLAAGDAATALKEPYTVVITKQLAAKYFGDGDPIGKVLKVDNRIDFTVTGILEEIPKNCHLEFNILASFNSIKSFGYKIDSWNSWAYATYITLAHNTNEQIINQKLKSIKQKYLEDAIVEMSLQPVADIHLYSGSMWGLGGTGDIKYVYIFSIIAAFILLLACINFMNLSTARASNRSVEIGLRKVVGAERKEVIYQFFGESIFYSFISLLFAIILVWQFIPLFNSISGKNLNTGIIADFNVFLTIIIITLLTGVISGIYPALILSAFKPVKVLKGTFKSGAKGSLFRRLLVSFQFILTIFLITSTIIVSRQLHFIRTQKLGFDKDYVLTLDLSTELRQKVDLLKERLLNTPGVISTSAVSSPPVGIKQSTVLSEWEGKDSDDKFLMYLLSADYDLASTIQLEMTEGRYYSREIISDTSDGIVVNEAAVRAMGMDSPLGKKVFGANIIGVMKDFNFSSLHSKIGPLSIYFSPEENDDILIKISSANIDQTIGSIKSIWNDFEPGVPFDFSFIDEDLNKLYSAEERIKKIVNVFTYLAIIIACLGLFGLASFTAEQRTKEVGIRKVLGASISGITLLLSQEFTKYVVLANLLAWPIAWYVMNQWLNGFAYRIEIGWSIFLLSGLLAFVIALLTVIYQAVKAGIANPVNSLKNE